MPVSFACVQSGSLPNPMEFQCNRGSALRAACYARIPSDNQRRSSFWLLNGNIKILFLFFREKEGKICIQNTIEVRIKVHWKFDIRNQRFLNVVFVSCLRIILKHWIFLRHVGQQTNVQEKKKIEAWVIKHVIKIFPSPSNIMGSIENDLTSFDCAQDNFRDTKFTSKLKKKGR